MSCAAVLTARYRPGVGAQAAHLVPLPVRAAVGVVSSFCGALLVPQKLEAVEPGQGMPCAMCVL